MAMANHTGKAPDRRMQRTREALHQALIALILRKNYEDITVQDIIDQANIGRSTFYAHYTGKEDLLRSGFENLRRLLESRQPQILQNQAPGREQILGFSLAMFEHARSHCDLYAALLGGRGGTVMLRQVRQLLAELVHKDLARQPRQTKRAPHEMEVQVQFVVGAFMSLLTWWMDHKARMPPQQIDAMFRHLALEGLQ